MTNALPLSFLLISQNNTRKLFLLFANKLKSSINVVLNFDETEINIQSNLYLRTDILFIKSDNFNIEILLYFA